MQNLPSILLLYRNKFNKSNNTRAAMLGPNYYITKITLKLLLWCENTKILTLYMQRCYGRRFITLLNM